MSGAVSEMKRYNVSRETLKKLQIIVSQLEKWQPRINLVAPSTMADIWKRHIADSLQLQSLMPSARRWIDLGSGGGFPGLVIAAVFAEFKDAEVTLVESNGKKCAFLRETARLSELPVRVVQARIENTIPHLIDRFDVVSARALAPLDNLLKLTAPLIAIGTTGIFPKGQDVDREIKLASISWRIEHELVESQTEIGAKIVVIKSAVRVT
jgi:16S rRNA (guanine527-N7)-methyltransferase